MDIKRMHCMIEKLSEKGLTKTKWFNDKVDEEIGN